MAITAEPTGGTPTTGAGEGSVLLIDLDQIRTDGNVRELAQDEVEGLAGLDRAARSDHPGVR